MKRSMSITPNPELTDYQHKINNYTPTRQLTKQHRSLVRLSAAINPKEASLQSTTRRLNLSNQCQQLHDQQHRDLPILYKARLLFKTNNFMYYRFLPSVSSGRIPLSSLFSAVFSKLLNEFAVWRDYSLGERFACVTSVGFYSLLS